MCGINGMTFLKGVKRDANTMRAIRHLFDELLIETQDRGEHATGISVHRRDGSYDFHKAKGTAWDMTTNDATYRQIIDAIDGRKTATIISHTRQLTKGTADNNDNNHPFDIGCVVGIHNGSIRTGNDDELFKIYENDFKRIGEVDSEVIYQMLNLYGKDQTNFTYDIVKRVLEQGHGDKNERLKMFAALAFVHKQTPTMLHLFKGHERPIDMAYWEEAGIIIFNSVEKYIKKAFMSLSRALKAFGIEIGLTVRYITVKTHHYLTVDANADNVLDAISEQKRIETLTNYTTSSYSSTGNAWGRGGTGSRCGTGNNSTCGTTTTKTSTGRVIEGILDEQTNEITIFTLEETAGATGSNGKVDCSECDKELTEDDKAGAWNNGVDDEHQVCGGCYEKMLNEHLGRNKDEEGKTNPADGVTV